jgi:tripartite motif-containing protein 71
LCYNPAMFRPTAPRAAIIFLIPLVLSLLLTGCGSTPQPPPANLTYEYDPTFDASATPLSGPTGVCIGADDLIYVVDTGNNRIVSFDDTGALAAPPVGAYGTGLLQFKTPIGIAADASSGLYVGDSDNFRVQVINTNGDFVRTFGSSGTDNGEFLQPTFIAVSGSSAYVVDSLQPRMQVFSTVGVFQRALGQFGIGSGQFSNPRGVAVVSSTTYVADGGGDRVEWFNNTGVFQGSFGSSGTAFGELRSPEGLAATTTTIYVADSGNNRIELFSTDGRPIVTFPNAGAVPQMNRPTGVAVDSAGQVYVTNRGSNQVQRWKPVTP